MNIFNLSLLLFLFRIFSQALSLRFESSVDDIQAAIKNGKSCREIVSQFIFRIHAYDLKGPKLRAVSILNPSVEEQARILDADFISSGKFRGPLHCVPILVTENIDVAGLPTAPGVGQISDSVPRINSKVVQLLTRAGAIVIGKTTGPPFGDELRTSKSLALNPYDLKEAQNGLAAALATGYAVFGIGTDTYGASLGSAARSNLLAFRPTWSRISNQGIMPDFYLQQTPSVLARTAKDLAVAMDVLDPVASAHKFSLYTSQRILNQNSFVGLKIGVPSLFTYKQLDILHPFRNRTTEYKVSNQMKTNIVEKSLSSIKSLGGTIRNLTSEYDKLEPYLEEIANLWFNLSSCKVSWMDSYFANSDRFPVSSPYHGSQDLVRSQNIPSEIRLSFKNLLEIRHLCPAAAEAFVEIRKMLTDDVIKSLFKKQDILLFPTSPDFSGNSFTPALLAAILGYPCISLPTGFSQSTVHAPQGIPGGMLFMAQPTDMDLLVEVSFAYQTRFPKHNIPWPLAAFHNSGTSSRLTVEIPILLLLSVYFQNNT